MSFPNGQQSLCMKYGLTIEQPEIMDSTEEPGDVTYDSVAIPEVHIRKKGTKPADQ